jgi:hypothetical protein
MWTRWIWPARASWWTGSWIIDRLRTGALLAPWHHAFRHHYPVPELFAPFLESGVTRRAYASGQVAVHLWNPRDWAEGNYRRVDDRPFGGGPGMVMMAEPLQRCLEAIRAARVAEQAQEHAACAVVLFSPIGAAQARWWPIGPGAGCGAAVRPL